MSELALIRHGRTAWNRDGRLTGRADIPLTTEGRRDLAGRRLPARFEAAEWLVSPLRRARQTARLLGHGDATVEAALIEMDFGTFEGRTLKELRADPGLEMAALEDRGLDFQPPGGESPRLVRERLRPLLRRLGQAGGLHVAVAHKSIIRAVFAAAYDWEMLGRPPLKLRWDCIHLFSLDPDGEPVAVEMNIAFETVIELQEGGIDA